MGHTWAGCHLQCVNVRPPCGEQADELSLGLHKVGAEQRRVGNDIEIQGEEKTRGREGCFGQHRRARSEVV